MVKLADYLAALAARADAGDTRAAAILANFAGLAGPATDRTHLDRTPPTSTAEWAHVATHLNPQA